MTFRPRRGTIEAIADAAAKRGVASIPASYPKRCGCVESRFVTKPSRDEARNEWGFSVSAGRGSVERRGIALAREDRILAPREGYARRRPRGTTERRVSGYRPKAKRDVRRRPSRHLRTLRDLASNVRVSPRRACESLAKRSAGRGVSRRPRAGLRRSVGRRAGSMAREERSGRAAARRVRTEGTEHRETDGTLPSDASGIGTQQRDRSHRVGSDFLPESGGI